MVSRMSPSANSPRLAARSFASHLVCGGLLALALLPGRRADAASIEARPLAALSGPRGPTMFTELTPEKTGLVTTNDYADPRMWGERYREFEVGAIGTGVAIGDYDGDERPDIFVVSKTE